MPLKNKGYHVTLDSSAEVPTQEELDRDLAIALSGEGTISLAEAFADDELEQGMLVYLESLGHDG